MIAPIKGIVPVMLTPFTPDNSIEWDDMARLIEWYIANGSEALFAVCQSSEMAFLSLKERVELAAFAVRMTNGRIPVVASGHIGATRGEQIEELLAMAETGIDALVLVTNRLDPAREGGKTFINNLKWLLERLPADLALGLYECPSPYRYLLSDDEFKFCRDSGWFCVLKDVSCDYERLMRRVEMARGSPLGVVNANAAIAWPALAAGAPGFCGIANNYHPDLYRWLQEHGHEHRELAEELAVFLTLASLSETYGYPGFAKLFHQRLGTIKSINCRVFTGDVREKFWGMEAIADRLEQGNKYFRARIAALTAFNQLAFVNS